MVFGRKKKKEQSIKEQSKRLQISQIVTPQSAETDNRIAEDIRLIIAEWLNPSHVPFKTRYNRRQVRSISVLGGLGEQWTINTLTKFIFKFQVALLSLEGKTSKELENILSKRMPELQNEGSIEKISKFLD